MQATVLSSFPFELASLSCDNSYLSLFPVRTHPLSIPLPTRLFPDNSPPSLEPNPIFVDSPTQLVPPRSAHEWTCWQRRLRRRHRKRTVTCAFPRPKEDGRNTTRSMFYDRGCTERCGRWQSWRSAAFARCGVHLAHIRRACLPLHNRLQNTLGGGAIEVFEEEC